MRYVVIRDDDTNALTPCEHLERLYRPFLERGLPVNLAVIPEVATNTKMNDGRQEGFLVCKNGEARPSVPIAANHKLVAYLLENPGYHVVQHGCHHDWLEFDRADSEEVLRRLNHGSRILMDAGFPQPETFVAPYDKLSRSSLQAVARHFRVLSGGWYELKRLPVSWWPGYLFKKIRHSPHWKIGRTLLLSHPGCLLSYQRDYSTMLDAIAQQVKAQRVTVLVTHWWEYFRNGQADEAFIGCLHQTADWLAAEPNLEVVSFAQLAGRTINWGR